jgi:signal peptidase II
MIHFRKSLRFGALALAVLAADQLSKLWVTRHLASRDSLAVIPGFAQFIRVENTGVVFGLMSGGGGWRPWVVLGLPLLLLPLLGWLLLTARRPIERWSYALILGGALGNLSDRVRFGHVVDFIDVYLSGSRGEHHWYTFNLADSAICVGAGLMAISLWRAPAGAPQGSVDQAAA